MRSRSAIAASRRTSSWLSISAASACALRAKLMFIRPTANPTMSVLAR